MSQVHYRSFPFFCFGTLSFSTHQFVTLRALALEYTKNVSATAKAPLVEEIKALGQQSVILVACFFFFLSLHRFFFFFVTFEYDITKPLLDSVSSYCSIIPIKSYGKKETTSRHVFLHRQHLYLSARHSRSNFFYLTAFYIHRR